MRQLFVPHWQDGERRLLFVTQQTNEPQKNPENVEAKKEFTSADALRELIQKSENPQELKAAVQNGANERLKNADGFSKSTEKTLADTDVKVGAMKKQTGSVTVSKQVVDSKKTEEAKRNNKTADDTANAVAGMFTLGAAPEAKTETALRTKTQKEKMPVPVESAVEQPKTVATDVPKEGTAVASADPKQQRPPEEKKAIANETKPEGGVKGQA